MTCRPTTLTIFGSFLALAFACGATRDARGADIAPAAEDPAVGATDADEPADSEVSEASEASEASAPQGKDPGGSTAPASVRRGVHVTEADADSTIVLMEGRPVVVWVASNPSTGYAWEITSVDRTFGLPEQTFVPGETIGEPGVARFVWQTTPEPFTKVGKHRVELSYVRPFERDTPAERVLRFTVDIRARGRRIELGQADKDARVDVLAGTAVDLALPSNPSTGFDWYVVLPTPGLRPPVRSYEPSSSLPGAPGITHLLWRTRIGSFRSGRSYDLEIAYRRPWEAVPPAQTFTFRFDVRR